MATLASKRRLLNEKKKLIFKYLDKWVGKSEITAAMLEKQFKISKNLASSLISEWKRKTGIIV